MKAKEERLWDSRFMATMRAMAPGTPLRDGLENVLRGRMGALVVLDDSPPLMEVVDGGFLINCEFTPSALYELAKMDGALILSSDARRILYANAQLVPRRDIPTTETGTRHRTAERVARQTGSPVIAISQRRNLITLYSGTLRYVVRDISTILNRANQALQTMERYQRVLNRGLSYMNRLEFEDSVTLWEVATVLITAEQIRRIALEAEWNIMELGTEGRLVEMHMEDLKPKEDIVDLLIKDYSLSKDAKQQMKVKEQLYNTGEDGLDPLSVCRMLGYSITISLQDTPVSPRGYRILSRVPRLPFSIAENVIARFETLQNIWQAGILALDEVEGVGEIRAKHISESLKNIRELAMN